MFFYVKKRNKRFSDVRVVNVCPSDAQLIGIKQYVSVVTDVEERNLLLMNLLTQSCHDQCIIFVDSQERYFNYKAKIGALLRLISLCSRLEILLLCILEPAICVTFFVQSSFALNPSQAP